MPGIFRFCGGRHKKREKGGGGGKQERFSEFLFPVDSKFSYSPGNPVVNIKVES